MRREHHLINRDWTFAYGELPGAEFSPGDSLSYDVGLPHTFDLPDFRQQRFYTGFGCYRRALQVPPSWSGAWIGLEFLGVFQVAEVFVNGMLVGRHEGGYTPFVIDITEAAVVGMNDVFVRVDNSWNPRLAPRAGDYSFSGGIYRDVSVIVVDHVRIDWYGIGVTTHTVDESLAEVVAEVEIVAGAGDEAELAQVEVEVVAVIRDADGLPVAHLDARSAAIAAGGRGVLTLTGELEEPRLWHPDTPHLYTLTASVLVEGTIRDEQTVGFGVRWFEFTAEDGFFLNGRHYDLHGANVHQNHGGWGDAVTRAGMRRDVTTVKELGMNIIRGSHYPHHLFFTDECDRQGLLYWSELHFWGIGGENIEGFWFASAYPIHDEDQPEFEESLRRALREMIRTQRNHPSIITWSIGNEAFFSDEHVVGKAKDLTRELVALARTLDPSRPAAVGGAQRKGFDVLGDIAGYNGDGAALFHDPGIPSVVSEYHGAGGRGPGDSEVVWEYGVEIDHRWRAGKILWCAFHYRTIADGAGLGGILDYFRVPRRPYHWYRQKLRGIEPPPVPRAAPGVALRVGTDAATIGTDGTDDARIVVEVVDADGIRVADDRPITLEVLGDGVMPSGRSITLSPETDSVLEGMAAIEFRAYRPGRNRIVAHSPGLPSAEVVVTAVGEAATVASPRFAPPPPSVTEPPRGTGDTSLAAYRPVHASSSAVDHEGSHVTATGSGTYWRPATDTPGEWIIADLEFPYDVSRVVVVFAEPPTDPWVLETSADARVYEEVQLPAIPQRELAARVDFTPRTASAVRVRFPRRPTPVEEIKVY